jgi:hypothetical protein
MLISLAYILAIETNQGNKPMRNFIKDMAVLSYAAAFCGFAITIAAMCYGETQAGLISTLVYVTMPLVGATLQSIADAA